MTRGTWSRFVVGLAAALAVAASPLLVVPARAGDDDPPPPPVTPDSPDSAVLARVNRGCPSKVFEEVLAWASEVAAAGRVRTGTTLGGHALLWAGEAVLQTSRETATALGYLKEAAAAFPPGSTGIGSALASISQAKERLGDPVGVLEALDALRPYEAMPRPGGDDWRANFWWDEVHSLSAFILPLRRAAALDALARHAEARAVYTALAENPPSNGGGPARFWNWAARSAWRGGDKTGAIADAEKALATSRDDEDVANRTVWILLAKYGLLAGNGDVVVSKTWPGPAFLADARNAARSVEGRKYAWKVPLQCAGYAMLSQNDAEALDLYERAFSDPHFAEVARDSPLYQHVVVTAVHVALRAKRPNDALRWLRVAEAAARGPVEGSEGLRIQIEEALKGNPPPWAQGNQETTPAERVDPAPNSTESKGPRPGIGPLPTAGGESGKAAGPEPEAGASASGNDFPAVPVAVALAALLAVLGLARLLARRGRERR